MAKTKETPVYLRPCDARFNQIGKLYRDNFTIGDFWLLTDGDYVTVTWQKSGESLREQVNVPRWIFNRLIAAYQRPQHLRQKKAAVPGSRAGRK